MKDNEKAREIVDRWHDEVNQVALRSLDPKYLADLRATEGLSRIYADVMAKHIATALREAREDERKACAEVAREHDVHKMEELEDRWDRGFHCAVNRITKAIETRALDGEK